MCSDLRSTTLGWSVWCSARTELLAPSAGSSAPRTAARAPTARRRCGPQWFRWRRWTAARPGPSSKSSNDRAVRRAHRGRHDRRRDRGGRLRRGGRRDRRQPPRAARTRGHRRRHCGAAGPAPDRRPRPRRRAGFHRPPQPRRTGHPGRTAPRAEGPPGGHHRGHRRRWQRLCPVPDAARPRRLPDPQRRPRRPTRTESPTTGGRWPSTSPATTGGSRSTSPT